MLEEVYRLAPAKEAISCLLPSLLVDIIHMGVLSEYINISQ
jgi:hypothetical protein